MDGIHNIDTLPLWKHYCSPGEMTKTYNDWLPWLQDENKLRNCKKCDY